MKILQLILRFIFLVLLQVWVLNEIAFQGFLNPYLYIAFILLFPPQASRIQLTLIGFILGLSIDIFENSMGLHAAAATFLGYLRPWLLRLFADRQEIKEENYRLNDMQRASFFIYLLMGVFTHHLVLFALENFSVNNLGAVLLRSLYSSGFTLLFIILYYFLKPKNVEKRR